MSTPPKITAGAIIRIAGLILALINTVLIMLGIPVLPVTDGDIANVINMFYELASILGIIWAGLAAYWKDNDITRKARIKKEQINRYDR